MCLLFKTEYDVIAEAAHLMIKLGRWPQVSTVAQLTVLQPVAAGASLDGSLCLLNTHLFFHPQAPHIRMLHVAAMLAEARALAESAAPELPQAPALLFCGDLNSDLNDGMPGEPACSATFSCRAIARRLFIECLADWAHTRRTS